MKNLIALLLLLISFLFFQCTSSDGKEETQPSIEKEKVPDLGKISIEVTGAAEAIPHFREGLLLMHSFEYEDAAAKFAEAQELDSTFAMAYWGEAMTKNHPLWRAQFTKEAQEILMRLAATKEERLAMCQTHFEKDMMEGAEILYGEGTKEERDVQYKDHMESLHQKYPDNHEVASLYALSLLGSVKGGRDYEVYGKAANVVKSIIAENAHHPGALHYLIHSYDDPDHAAKALQAANSYSKVAPDAGHALHMPSHIYIAMGMWDQVINSNQVSYDASVERMKRKDLDNDARGYHALKWLMYGYMQKGNYEKARELVEDMKTYCYEKPSPRARSHFIQMRALYLTESGNWQDSIALDTVSYDDLIITLKGVQRFVDGMIAFKAGDQSALDESINMLEKEIEDANNAVTYSGGKMCSGVSYYNQLPNQQDINRAQVTLYQLQALRAKMNKKDSNAIALMEKAVELEEATSFVFGPPEIVKPAPEMYAEMLLEKGDMAGAKVMFEKVLERAPKRKLAVEGLESAS